VRELFGASQRSYGSPRIHADLVEAGEAVSVNTVANSMRRQGLQGRKPKRRRGSTRQDRSAPKFPDLLHRDFTAAAPNMKWCGDITETPLTKASCISPRCWTYIRVGCWPARPRITPTPTWPAMRFKTAAAVRRGGRAAIDGVIFHTDRGSTHTAGVFTTLCRKHTVPKARGVAVDGEGRFMFR
jgi:putative transposase